MNDSSQDSSAAELRRRHEFQTAVFNAILDATLDGILVVDNQARIIAVNRRFFQLWRIEFTGEEGQHGVVLSDADDQPVLAQVVDRVKNPDRFIARVKELYADPTLVDYAEIELKDGRTLERHSRVLRGEDDQYLGRVWFFHDITEHKQEETTLTELARTDSLTGIANRRYFYECAHEEFVRARRLRQSMAVLVVDTDYFKRINDHYGHAAGDAVLKALCRHFLSELREIDVLGRIGGDEFAVILPSAGINDACAIAERLRSSVAQLTIPVDDHRLNCTITIGVAVIHDNDRQEADLLKRADEALYRAKAAGRNRVEVETG